jgi:hypothetical protein
MIFGAGLCVYDKQVAALKISRSNLTIVGTASNILQSKITKGDEKMRLLLGITRKMLFVLFAVQILLSISSFAASDGFQPFTVTGNAGVFSLDEDNKVVKLADCRITNVRSGSDRWTIPETYQTADSVQHLFDLVIGGDLYPLTKEQKKAIHPSFSWTDDEAGKYVSIDFESIELADMSRGTNSLPDGQGLGFLTLYHCEKLPEAYPDNLVYATMFLITNKGKTTHSFCMESQALYDLLEEMLVQE